MSTNPKEPEDKNEHAKANARGWAESIAEDMAALALARDGQDPCERCEGDGEEPGAPVSTEEKALCTACDGEGNIDSDESKAEEIRERIREGPLSLEVRSGWYSPGGEGGAPEDFCILLSTGGPALRIIGELDEYGQPTRAYMEWQDWGTPWTHIYDIPLETETLLDYCREFYFGEGGR